MCDDRAGVYTVDWRGTDHGSRVVGSGVYFYRMRAGAEEVREMLRVR